MKMLNKKPSQYLTPKVGVFFAQGIHEDEVIDLVERSIEELTIALMQDRLNVEERFVLKDKNSDLNVVCLIQAGKISFNLIIITVMKNSDFRVQSDQFVLEI